jgi:hypothetical protein
MVRVVAVVVLKPGPTYAPLAVVPPIIDTAILVTAAVFVFHRLVAGRGLAWPLHALIGWRLFTLDTISAFKYLALRALFVSFVPIIALVVSAPAYHWPYVIGLAAMHVTAWAVCVSMLTRLTAVEHDDGSLDQDRTAGDEGWSNSQAGS